MAEDLTHFDAEGRPRMVDVSDKDHTDRMALATGRVRMSQATYDLAMSGTSKKGDVRQIAELAGIMGAKQTSALIPLCHPLPLSSVRVRVEGDEKLPGLIVSAETKTAGQTGVEMEALTAVSVACLTIYDMLKAVDPAMTIEQIELAEKKGGKSGHWQRETSDG